MFGHFAVDDPEREVCQWDVNAYGQWDADEHQGEREDDGTIFIAAVDGVGYKQAKERIEALTEEVEVGRIYTGKVVRVTDFGAFVELLPGTDGLVHISQLDTSHVNKVTDVVKTGDEISVMVTNVDNQGKIRLSRKALLEGWTLEEAQAQDGGGRKSSNRGRNRGSRNRYK